MKVNNFLFGLVALAFLGLGVTRFEQATDVAKFTLYCWLLIFFLINDIRYWRIPPFMALGALLLGLLLGNAQVVVNFQDRLIGAVAAFVFLWCVLISSTWILRRTSRVDEHEFALGPGDPLLLAVVGSFVGYMPLAGILFLASLQGMLAYLLSFFDAKLSASRSRLNLHSQAVPFGAFLCLSALELAAWPNLLSQIQGIIRSLI